MTQTRQFAEDEVELTDNFLRNLIRKVSSAKQQISTGSGVEFMIHPTVT